MRFTIVRTGRNVSAYGTDNEYAILDEQTGGFVVTDRPEAFAHEVLHALLGTRVKDKDARVVAVNYLRAKSAPNEGSPIVKAKAASKAVAKAAAKAVANPAPGSFPTTLSFDEADMTLQTPMGLPVGTAKSVAGGAEIVRRWNAHETLVEALEDAATALWLLREYEGTDSRVRTARARINEARALAGAK